MAETIPTGTPNPDGAENQQETRAERRRRRRDLARASTTQERAASPEVQAQAAALQQTDAAKVGTGLLGQVARLPVDATRGVGRLGWKAIKFGGRVAVGAVKYPAMAGGLTVLAGGGATGGLLYFVGKGVKFALGPAVRAGIHYDKKFGEGFDMTWKPIMEYAGGKNRKK